jgi:hypothetical protein
MYQRDYILRLIERFGKILIALRNGLLKREAEDPLLPAQLREVAQQAGLDLDLARRLEPAMLLMWLSPGGGELDAARLWLMAELLYLEGLHAGGAAGHADFERALAILLRLPREWRPASDFDTVGERVDELRALLAH